MSQRNPSLSPKLKCIQAHCLPAIRQGVRVSQHTARVVDPGTTMPLSLMLVAPAAFVTTPAVFVAAPPVCDVEEAGVEPRMLPPVSGLFEDPAAGNNLRGTPYCAMRLRSTLWCECSILLRTAFAVHL